MPSNSRPTALQMRVLSTCRVPAHRHLAHHRFHAPPEVAELPVQGVHDAAGSPAVRGIPIHGGHVRRVPVGAVGIGVVDVDVIADGRAVAAFALVDGAQQAVPAAGPRIDLVDGRVAVIVALVLPADQVDELGDAVGGIMNCADDLRHLRVGGEHLVVLDGQEHLVGDGRAVQIVGVRQRAVDPERPVAPVDDAVAVVVPEEHHLHVERPHRARAHPVPVVVESDRVAAGAVGMALRQQGEVAVHESAQPGSGGRGSRASRHTRPRRRRPSRSAPATTSCRSRWARIPRCGRTGTPGRSPAAAASRRSRASRAAPRCRRCAAAGSRPPGRSGSRTR